MKHAVFFSVAIFLLGQCAGRARPSENSTCSVQIEGCSYRVAVFPTETCKQASQNQRQSAKYSQGQSGEHNLDEDDLIRRVLSLLALRGKIPLLTEAEERSLEQEIKLTEGSSSQRLEEDDLDQGYDSIEDFDSDLDLEDEDSGRSQEDVEGSRDEKSAPRGKTLSFNKVGEGNNRELRRMRRKRSLQQGLGTQANGGELHQDRATKTRHRRRASSYRQSGKGGSTDRGRRETMPGAETAVTSGNPDFDRLTKKMKKLMEKLSVRILRWWRKLDKKLDSLEARRASNGMTSANLVYGQCPNGFQRLDNWPSCYLLTQFNATWYEAKEYCSAFDSDLVAMGTVKEHYLLTFLIKNSPSLAAVPGWWTSGSFLGNTKQWMWTSAFYTKPFTFIKWGEGMPRDDGMQCMLLRASDDHKWHDAVCTERYNFICESTIKSY